MSFTGMASLQLEMFLMMAIGFLCKKIKLINDEAQRSLSDILIDVILPANILHSFTSGVKVSTELLQNCALAFIISLCIQLAATYGGRRLFGKWPQEKSAVASYGMIVSNSSFIGIPVADRVFGNLGVVYTSVFQIPIRFTMWSAGLALFTSVDKRQAFKKVVTHPCIIACLAGFAMMLTGLTFPGILGEVVKAMSQCTSPVSMMVIGAILACADWRQLFRTDVLLFCLYRLVLFPLIVWGILYALHADPTLAGVAVLLTAMPAGSTTAILPQKYNCDAEYGAGLIFTSTLFSILTIPLFTLLLG